MDRKIRVAAVSYLNTKPLVYGFEKGMMKDEIEVVFDYPAKVAALLLKGEADIGLIPVAVIPQMKDFYIVSDYCIGASADVASVCLFSDVPIGNISNIFLDYQSKTSVALLKILLKDHWKISPELIQAEPGYEEQIHGNSAGLVIGDRALTQRKHSKYVYDLAGAWQEMTGLPFVFAAWVSNKKLPEVFLESFNKATAEGFDHISDIVEANPFPDYDLHKYYTANIDYTMDAKMRQGLDLFLEKLSADK